MSTVRGAGPPQPRHKTLGSSRLANNKELRWPFRDHVIEYFTGSLLSMLPCCRHHFRLRRDATPESLDIAERPQRSELLRRQCHLTRTREELRQRLVRLELRL